MNWQNKGLWRITFVISIIASILGFWFVEVCVDIEPVELVGMFIVRVPFLAGLFCCILLVRRIRKGFRKEDINEKEVE